MSACSGHFCKTREIFSTSYIDFISDIPYIVHMRHTHEYMERRLLAHSAVNEASPVVNGKHCREWQKRGHAQGYGKLWDGERVEYTHRLAYEAATGDRPGTLDVLHACDNTCCIEPAHLRAGTAADNTADMIARGRHLRGRAVAALKTRGRQSEQRGSKHVLAKLTEKKTLEIKARLKRPWYTANRPAALAREFGVSDSTIRAIKAGKSWGWLR